MSSQTWLLPGWLACDIKQERGVCQACITLCVPLLVHLQSNTAAASCFGWLGGGGKEERVCNMRLGKTTVFPFFFHCSALASFLFTTELNKHYCLFSEKKGGFLGTGYFWGTAHTVKIAWPGFFLWTKLSVYAGLHTSGYHISWLQTPFLYVRDYINYLDPFPQKI